MAVTSGPSPKNDDELLINFLLKFAANGGRILQNSENVEEQSNHLSNPRISLKLRWKSANLSAKYETFEQTVRICLENSTKHADIEYSFKKLSRLILMLTKKNDFEALRNSGYGASCRV